jgi:putative NADH-flavin reductase
MKIALFGATGKTGTLVLYNLLAKSYTVTALVRTPAKITLTSPQLKLVQGDALILADVERAIEGCDTVISVLGLPSLKPSTILTTSVGNIATAMKNKGVKRIISMGSAGILNEMSALPGLIIGFILRNVLKDHRGSYTILRDSPLEWTVVRPLTLTDGNATGRYRITETGLPKNSRSISRADVADFIVHTLEQGTYIRQSPAIAD